MNTPPLLCQKTLIALSLTLVLSACGGGSDGGTSTVTPSNPTSTVNEDINTAVSDQAGSLWSSTNTDTGSADTNTTPPSSSAEQAEDHSNAINDESESLWQLQEQSEAAARSASTNDALSNLSARNMATYSARQSVGDYSFDVPPQSPVSKAGQLLNVPASPSGRFTVTDRQWPAAFGDMNVSMWSQDKLAAFSLTIDDNHVPNHDFWFSVAEEYGWKWTWFVIANQVGWASHDHWGHWQKALDKGHDIQSHTYSHLCDAIFYTYREYRQSQAAINQNLTGSSVLTMAYPFGINSNKVGSPCASLDTDRTANSRQEASLHYLAARDVYGALSNPAKIDFMQVPSVSAARNFFNSSAPWAHFDSVLDPSSNNYRTWYSTHYHGIYGTQAEDDVRKVLAHVKANEANVWVGSFTQVAKYGQEYATAKLTTHELSANKIVFEVKDEMYDAWFDEPLTVKIRLPNGWSGTAISAIQNNQSVTASIVTHNNQAYALVSAVPDSGNVEVTF